MITSLSTATLLNAALHDPGGKVHVRWPDDSKITPVFSACGRYRYELQEVWDTKRRVWLWVLMNPSVAGLEFSDQTVSKTGRMSRLGGAGGQIIMNTGAYRSTSPAGLRTVSDPVGPANESTILRLAQSPNVAKLILAYCKPPKALRGQGIRLARLLHERGVELHVLRLSKDGTPMHPLSRGKGFIPISTGPTRWVPPHA